MTGAGAVEVVTAADDDVGIDGSWWTVRVDGADHATEMLASSETVRVSGGPTAGPIRRRPTPAPDAPHRGFRRFFGARSDPCGPPCGVRTSSPPCSLAPVV